MPFAQNEDSLREVCRKMTRYLEPKKDGEVWEGKVTVAGSKGLQYEYDFTGGTPQPLKVTVSKASMGSVKLVKKK